MPARVHALLVVRPDGRPSAAFHLRRTLAALKEQRRPVDALTIVICGEDAAVRELAASSGAESVITASAGTSFAAATTLGTHRLDGDAVWLLAQDTAPSPTRSPASPAPSSWRPPSPSSLRNSCGGRTAPRSSRSECR